MKFTATVKRFIPVRLSLNTINIPFNMAATSSSGYYEGNQDTLIFAHVLFRHGASNIATPYPNDPHKDESYWPDGFGQLTKEGKLQLYRLGQYLRRRYDHLIAKTYSRNDIYVLSTDFDRTIMSAQACLAGLYPPTDGEKFRPDIKWQPIPVHTIPLKSDQVLSTGFQCPRFELAHAEYIQHNPEMVHIRNKYLHLFNLWSTHSGMEINQSLDVVNLLYNTLSIEKECNKSLPQWANAALQPDSPMQYIANANFRSYSATPQLARLKQGLLIREIIERFVEKLQGLLEPDRKLWLYSAHDLTIVSVLNSLKLFEFHFPPYGASVHFELFRTERGEYYFQIFYRRNGEEYPKAMNVPGCGTKCSLQQFYDLFQDIIPDDLENECQIPPGMAMPPNYEKKVDYLDLL